MRQGDASGRQTPAVDAARHRRRLTDKILAAFHAACDVADYEIADHLLRTLELLVARRQMAPDVDRRRHLESLVAAHERLWHLRHPGIVDG